jgi:Leucine-rich repeat (LRR) protein
MANVLVKAQHIVTEWLDKGRTGPLNLSRMGLTALPPLPPDLTDLRCVGNALTALPPLPPNLQILIVAENRLTELPSLPSVLVYLDVTDNRLASLPLPLPHSLEQLYCSDNRLTDEGLPPTNGWPPRLNTLYCTHNRLRNCPDVPSHVSRRHVSVCWTFRPHLLRGAMCPCCGQPAGAYGI